jgi:dTMP kinase
VEREPLEFHERLRRGYLTLAEAQPQRFLVLDALLPPDQLVARALPVLRERLGGWPRI